MATGNIRVKDIGTEFSIRRLDERHAQVLVKDGKVRIERVALAAEGQSKTVASVDLAAGETIVVDEGRTDPYMGEIRKLPVTEVERKLEWTDGRIAFSGESLSEAIAEFNRYNQRQLWVADAGIGQLRIGGQFDATDFDGFVKTLNKAYGLHGQRAAKAGDIRTRLTLASPPDPAVAHRDRLVRREGPRVQAPLQPQAIEQSRQPDGRQAQSQREALTLLVHRLQQLVHQREISSVGLLVTRCISCECRCIPQKTTHTARTSWFRLGGENEACKNAARRLPASGGACSTAARSFPKILELKWT